MITLEDVKYKLHYLHFTHPRKHPEKRCLGLCFLKHRNSYTENLQLHVTQPTTLVASSHPGWATNHHDSHLKCITQGKGFQQGSIWQTGSRYHGEALQVNKRVPCLPVNASEPVPNVGSLTPKQPQKKICKCGTTGGKYRWDFCYGCILKYWQRNINFSASVRRVQ